MTAPQVAPEIVAYYTTHHDEAGRLTATADGRLEYVRTQELLRRHLPLAATILDVGGGTGVHARWLADDGHRVHLVDPIARHVAAAGEAGLDAEVGDARELGAADAAYDVVLLLGPLYHLTDQDDRRRALREARRVLRPGGVLAAAGINRYAALLEQTATTGLAREPVRHAVEGILTSHQLQLPHALGVAHFHTAGELAAEVQEAGFEPAALYSVEGPGWLVLKAVEQAGAAVVDTPVFQAALAAARMADGHTDLDAAGSHFLAIGRRPRRPE